MKCRINSSTEHEHLCHGIIQRQKFALRIIVDERTLIGLESVKKSPDSNVRFCLNGDSFIPL